ncbi:MAG: hypothetical protein ACI3YK_06015 [Eubacteriales bacterium]
MKRIFRVLCLILLMFSLVLSSCSGDSYTCTDLLAYLRECYGQNSNCKIYFNGAENQNYLDEDKIMTLFDGMNPAKLCEDYAVCLSTDDQIFEIYIFRPISNGRFDEVEKILRRRLDLLQRPDVYLYDCEGYEAVVSSGEIVRKGSYVILLLTPDNSLAEKRLNELLG